MKVVVTGAAGFIGSTLVEALAGRGDEVVGVDCFTPYYERERKEANLQAVRSMAGVNVELIDADLRTCDVRSFLDGVDVVFHHAAQPGVRLSWDEFEAYESHNVLATERLLRAARDERVGKVVYASSSSVYGNTTTYPTPESALPRPHSPYGVTKLAAEHLCGLYAENWRVRCVALRYFTVYGPRQRPDMAMHRLLRGALLGDPFPLFGDGSAIRDFTFVGDVVRANLATADADLAPGSVLNVAGGGSHSMSEVLQLVRDLVGAPVAVDQRPAQAGDVRRTGGDITAAAELLGWSPRTGLREGLEAQLDWQRSILG